MVMDSFKYEQRKLLSELSDKEIVITEVRDLENSRDVEIRVNFKNLYDKEKFINVFDKLCTYIKYHNVLEMK